MTIMERFAEAMKCPNCGDASGLPCRWCAMYGAHGGNCLHASPAAAAIGIGQRTPTKKRP